jgi:hypothetical protein
MCPTCPWREGSPTAELRAYLEEESWKRSRICHSTNGNRVIKQSKQTSKKPLICRGSRNYQLQFLVAMGFLTEATDEAWDRKHQEIESRK